MSSQPREKLDEIVGLLLLAFFVLISLSLLSYNIVDPSLDVSSPFQHYANYVGRYGAWIADFLLQSLGLSAFCLPVPLLLFGIRKLRGKPVEQAYLKLFAFCTLIASLSSGLALTSSFLPQASGYTPGGAVGIVLSDRLLRNFNRPGSLVLVLTLLLLSLLVGTRFSLQSWGRWLGGRQAPFQLNLAGRFSQWRQRRRNRRELARANRAQTMLAQTAPRKTIELELPDKRSLEKAEATIKEGSDAPPVKVRAPVQESLDHPLQAPGPGRKGSDPNFQLPPQHLLQSTSEDNHINEQELLERAHRLSTKCAEFDVHGRVLQIDPGPVVTTFEFKPDAGVKYSRITSLADDLCLALKAESIRIDRIPGKNTVGMEVPNLRRQTIYLKDIISSAAFPQSKSPLTLALGKTINGNTYVSDLTRMPHLLIAGATGSGKSVSLNCMVCSILYKSLPEEVRFIMIDPKRLELGVYEGIPHLLTPIVTDPKKAANALNWAVREMEERYKILARHGVRNIDQFNRSLLENHRRKDEEELQPLPYIVIIVDELADLMMTAGKEVEASLTRLAQMARAIGIHLILATQRPSVDVLTGLIKANFPCRISFRVSQKVDSRTILDCNGAEQLLGHGDMLFLPPGTSRLLRIHGAYVSEKEIGAVTRFLKAQAQPEYQEEVLEGEEVKEEGLVDVGDLEDDLYEQAAHFVVETGKASTSLLQRRLRIGYGRAARLLDMMEHEGLIGPPDGTKPREVLVPPDYFSEIDEN